MQKLMKRLFGLLTFVVMNPASQTSIERFPQQSKHSLQSKAMQAKQAKKAKPAGFVKWLTVQCERL